MDALPGGCAGCVPERRGARAAREQRSVGAHEGRGLWLPTPAARAPLPAPRGQARNFGRGLGEPRARAQRCPWESRASLARRVDAAPSEAAAEGAAGPLPGSLSQRAGQKSSGRCSHIKAHFQPVHPPAEESLLASRASPSRPPPNPAGASLYASRPCPDV